MSGDSFSSIKPHVKNLGGFTVKRLLPSHPHKMVGPFIFFDHMGPAIFPPGEGMDVRPHPHIGLATVTYLFEGTILHRDSLGSVQPIQPGDVNWMTAGQGIVHSERTPDALRQSGGSLHGIQTWVALPKEHEKTFAAFTHHPMATLPIIELPGVMVRIIAGTIFGKTAPAAVFSDLFYATAILQPDARLTISAEHLQRAIYLVEGELTIEGEPVDLHNMNVLTEGREITIVATTEARIMLLGGAPLEGDRFVWWNFVASDRASIDEARERWREQRFGAVPGETEWIPLPPEPKPAGSFS